MPAGEANGPITHSYALRCIEGALTCALRLARLEVSDELVEALEKARQVARDELEAFQRRE